MIDRISWLAVAAMCLPAAVMAASAEHSFIEEARNDVGNIQSLQRGARDFVNYCLGCHSARYVRHNRLAEDLGLSEDQLIRNLMFTADKPFETMEIAMPSADAQRWFGRTPPDLSLAARSRGTAWLYSYLKSFYIDESSPVGVGNLVLPGAAMPHVLWELQGMQRAVFREEVDAEGNSHEIFERFEQVTEGILSAAEYDDMVRDLVNFLDYIGEPIQLERRNLGLRVLAFLFVFYVLAYALKKEYWKDVH